MKPDPDLTSDVPGMHIWGWMSEPELQWLIAAAANSRSVVEVGSLHGRSSFALAVGCDGPVFCIDPWDDEHDQSFPSFKNAVADKHPNVVPIRNVSPDAAETFDALHPDPASMVFLDGAHSREAVLVDIATWLPRAALRLCGHDFYDGPDAGFPGVAEAVKEVFEPEAFRVVEGTSIWCVELPFGRDHLRADLPRMVHVKDEYGRDREHVLDWG